MHSTGQQSEIKPEKKSFRYPRHLPVNSVRANGKVLDDKERAAVFSPNPLAKSNLTFRSDICSYTLTLKKDTYVFSKIIYSNTKSTLFLLAPFRTPHFKVAKQFSLDDRSAPKFAANEQSLLTIMGKSSDPVIVHTNDKNEVYHFVISDYEHGYDLDGLHARRNNASWPEFQWPNLKLLYVCVGTVDAALEVLQKDILHHDYSPANFMLDPVDDTCTLLDFSFASKAKRSPQGELQSCRNKYFFGTERYMAPDLIAQRISHPSSYIYTSEMGVFSLGIILQEIAFNQSANIDKTDLNNFLAPRVFTARRKGANDNALFEEDDAAKETKKALTELFTAMQNKSPLLRPSLQDVRSRLWTLAESYASSHREEHKKIEDSRETARKQEEARCSHFEDQVKKRRRPCNAEEEKQQKILDSLERISDASFSISPNDFMRSVNNIMRDLADFFQHRDVVDPKLKEVKKEYSQIYDLVIIVCFKIAERKQISTAINLAAILYKKDFPFKYHFTCAEILQNTSPENALNEYNQAILCDKEIDPKKIRQAKCKRVLIYYKLEKYPELIIEDITDILNIGIYHESDTDLIGSYYWALCNTNKNEKAIELALARKKYHVRDFSLLVKLFCNESENKDTTTRKNIIDVFDNLLRVCPEPTNAHFIDACRGALHSLQEHSEEKNASRQFKAHCFYVIQKLHQKMENFVAAEDYYVRCIKEMDKSDPLFFEAHFELFTIRFKLQKLATFDHLNQERDKICKVVPLTVLQNERLNLFSAQCCLKMKMYMEVFNFLDPHNYEKIADFIFLILCDEENIDQHYLFLAEKIKNHFSDPAVKYHIIERLSKANPRTIASFNNMCNATRMDEYLFEGILAGIKIAKKIESNDWRRLALLTEDKTPSCENYRERIVLFFYSQRHEDLTKEMRINIVKFYVDKNLLGWIIEKLPHIFPSVCLELLHWAHSPYIRPEDKDALLDSLQFLRKSSTNPFLRALLIDLNWHTQKYVSLKDATIQSKNLLEEEKRTTLFLDAGNTREKNNVFNAAFVSNRLGFLECDAQNYSHASTLFDEAISFYEMHYNFGEYFLAKIGSFFTKLMAPAKDESEEKATPTIDQAIKDMIELITKKGLADKSSFYQSNIWDKLPFVYRHNIRRRLEGHPNEKLAGQLLALIPDGKEIIEKPASNLANFHLHAMRRDTPNTVRTAIRTATVSFASKPG